MRRSAPLKPSGVPLDPASRPTRTSLIGLPTTTRGTAAAKRSWSSREVGLVARGVTFDVGDDAVTQPDGHVDSRRRPPYQPVAR